VAKLHSTGGVGRQEHDQLLPIVLGGSELDVVEFESAGVGVAETLARSFESSNRVFFPELVGTLATGSGILVYTYLARILAATAHVTGTALTIALLAWGVGASFGAFGSGWLADRYGANRTLLVAIAGMGVVLLGLGYADSLALVLALMVVGGACSWAVNAPINHRLTGLAPALPGVVISLNSSGTYLGQALGALAGGLLLTHHSSATSLCVIAAAAAAVTLCAQAVSMLRVRLRGRVAS
jgi:MFS transporter, DHA1 family, inner membrane transport protein